MHYIQLITRKTDCSSSLSPSSPSNKSYSRRAPTQYLLFFWQQLKTGRTLGNLQLLLVHIRRNIRKHGCRQVAFPRVGQHGQQDTAFGCGFGRFHGRVHGRATRYPRQDSLIPCQRLSHGNGLDIRCWNVLVVQIQLQGVFHDFGNKVWGPPLDRVRRKAAQVRVLQIDI